MKKGLIALLIILMVIALVGCNSTEQPSEQGEQTGEEQAEQGEVKKLIVGTSADFPPFENLEVVDGKETIVGFDIDLINELQRN